MSTPVDFMHMRHPSRQHQCGILGQDCQITTPCLKASSAPYGRFSVPLKVVSRTFSVSSHHSGERVFWFLPLKISFACFWNPYKEKPEVLLFLYGFFHLTQHLWDSSSLWMGCAVLSLFANGILELFESFLKQNYCTRSFFQAWGGDLVEVLLTGFQMMPLSWNVSGQRWAGAISIIHRRSWAPGTPRDHLESDRSMRSTWTKWVQSQRARLLN